MTELPDLKELTSEAKDALIESLWQEVQKLRKAVEKPPKKTSKNSSLPPSQGFKRSLKPEIKPSETSVQREGSLGRTGGGRTLSEQPDQIVQARLQQCGDCGVFLSPDLQRVMQRYDKIEIPPIRAVVTQVERYGCDCPNCGKAQLAGVPASLAAGSPFGQSVAVLVTTLRYSHAISYARMQQLMQEVFGLEISEGGIANLLRQVKQELDTTVNGIATRLRQARVIGSDETSARVQGINQWEWVFQNDELCLHVIRPSRGADVMREVLAGHRPEVWVSDLFSAQKTHPAEDWQVCLAHQLRDCQYAVEAGDEVFAPRMKRLLLWSIAVRHRWDNLAESTRYQYLNRLHRQLRELLKLSPTQADGIRLQNRYQDLRENLFLFLEDTTIPPTNNASEQALRFSVIFRKVTNGFRSDWGRDLFANIRSIVNTGKRQGLSAFQAISRALDPSQSLFPPS
jgi:transposase